MDTETVTLTYEIATGKEITAYTIFPEAWDEESSFMALPEAVFAHYVMNEHNENDLHEWIMRLIGNVLSEYNFEDAQTVEEFKALAEAALKDPRAN